MIRSTLDHIDQGTKLAKRGSPINFDLPQTIMTAAHKLTYGQRAARFTNPAAKALLETMERKKSNLSVSVDVVKSADLLAIVDTVGPYICLIKA